MDYNRREFLAKAIGIAVVVAGCTKADLSIGNAAIEDNPEVQALGRELAKSANLTSAQIRQSFSELHTLSHGTLKEQILNDFRGGHTVEADGWILSKTEVIICLFYFHRLTA